MPDPVKYPFPNLSTDSEAMQAVLLAEVSAPGGSRAYTEEKAKTSMSAMVATVQNRLTASTYFNPVRIFGVSNPTTYRDIIGASNPVQFEGFSGLVLGTSQTKNIQSKLDVANKETPEAATKENSYSRFVDFAKDYATSNVKDPFKVFGGAYGWRTAGSGSPGGDYYVQIPAPNGTILGNSFYTIRGYDVSFVIDSTGSMGDDIATVNSVSNKLIDKVSKPFLLAGQKGNPTPNSRFSLVSYKDPGEVTVNLPFTESVMLQPQAKGEIKNAIGAIGASGGGDYPEGVNSGLLAALNLEWRANPMQRRIILIGDAPAKDSNLANSVKSKASKPFIDIDYSNLKPDPPAPNPNRLMFRALAAEAEKISVPADPVRIFTIFTGFDSFAEQQFRDIAEATGGKAFSARVGGLEEALLAAFDAISSEIVGTGANDNLVGTEKGEDIIGLGGGDTLTGLGGADTFIIGSFRDAGDIIRDFTVGEDKISIGQLMSSVGYFGGNPITDGYINFKAIGSQGTLLQVDLDGPRGGDIFRPLAFFEKVTELALNNINNFVF